VLGGFFQVAEEFLHGKRMTGFAVTGSIGAELEPHLDARSWFSSSEKSWLESMAVCPIFMFAQQKGDIKGT
jgi:hypothetical protein